MSVYVNFAEFHNYFNNKKRRFQVFRKFVYFLEIRNQMAVKNI